MIIKPVSNQDQPLEFQSEFPFTINIEAELRNVVDATSVAVQVSKLQSCNLDFKKLN
jgi:hypothetical protein